MSSSHPHNYPKLHNAMWPGLVGKGSPGAEPTIDLDTMLDLTAAAEVDGIKFDGVDIFLYEPHINIDIKQDDLKAVANKIVRKGFVVGTVVAPVWFDGSAMGDDGQRANYLNAIRKACGIARSLREMGIRPNGVVRIDSASPVAEWAKDPVGNQAKIAETFKQAAAIARDHGERLAAEGEICWGGMHSWRAMVDLLERVGEPDTVGFQADMAHTLLYTLGENAPEDRLLPKEFDWHDACDARRGAQDIDRILAAVDDRLPRRTERRNRLRLGHARPHRAALPGDRPQRQARHPTSCQILASRRERQADEEMPAHLLGRLHVPQ